MFDSMEAASGTRAHVYSEILGAARYAQLTARVRGHIFCYAARHKTGEVRLLRQIADGEITIDAIEADHRGWALNGKRS